MRLQIRTIVPFIHESGVGIRIGIDTDLDHIPKGYYPGDRCGRDVWSHSINCTLGCMNITCVIARDIHFDGTSINVIIPGEKLDYASIVQAIRESDRFQIVGEHVREVVPLSEVLRPVMAG